ncbi:YcaO-like family protein [Thermopolyspora sp. NPDC052614]|uniref:YcaO-like family protein n=1 Tax=Thermopolyspora sp. NPDC052614 TaxID=3155682 RepID=UPI00342C4279
MSIHEAGGRIGAVLARLGLEPELTELGGGGDPTAYSCRLLAADGDMPPMARGMGKGHPEEARVGALFEALEHYLTGPARYRPETVETVEPARIAAGPLGEEAWSPLLAGLRGRLACHRYRPFGQGPGILVPLFLFAPWYVEHHAGRLREQAADTCEYDALMRYSCNSGSAIGVTAAEALLHALNEVIERDALSLLLVRAFLCPGESRLRLIDPATLPAEAAVAFSAAERATGTPVHLLDISGDLGVPTMLAYTPPTGSRPPRRGSGTSLSPGYAAWRALTELLQAALGETLPGAHVRGPDLTGLAAYPELHACGRFDLTEHLREAVTVPFAAGAGPPPEHPRAQVRRLVALLTARGHPPYRRTVAALPGRVVAVHAVVPGLERFMLVTDGNLVLPGLRGRRWCRAARVR